MTSRTDPEPDRLTSTLRGSWTHRGPIPRTHLVWPSPPDTLADSLQAALRLLQAALACTLLGLFIFAAMWALAASLPPWCVPTLYALFALNALLGFYTILADTRPTWTARAAQWFWSARMSLLRLLRRAQRQPTTVYEIHTYRCPVVMSLDLGPHAYPVLSWELAWDQAELLSSATRLPPSRDIPERGRVALECSDVCSLERSAESPNLLVLTIGQACDAERCAVQIEPRVLGIPQRAYGHLPVLQRAAFRLSPEDQRTLLSALVCTLPYDSTTTLFWRCVTQWSLATHRAVQGVDSCVTR